MKLEIGVTYNVKDGFLDFKGVLLDIGTDGTVFVQSLFTGSRYWLEADKLK